MGLVHLFNEQFMENLVIRMVNILDNMSEDGGLLDLGYYHKNRGVQQMTEFIQNEIENEMRIMKDIGEDTKVLEKSLELSNGKINQFYPTLMWWKSSEDIKREDILSLKKAMLDKAMCIVVELIKNPKTAVF